MTPFRAMALLVAAGSLAGLSLSAPRGSRGAAATIVVAAPGATPALVRRTADSARAPVFVLSGAGDVLRFGSGAEGAPDLAWILRRSPGIGRIIVAGWGLDDAELDQASGRTIVLASGRPGEAPLPAGVATVRWTGSVPEGTALTLRGSTAGLPVGTVVRIVGPDGGGDSAHTAPDSTFVLSVRPAVEGRLEFLVSAGAGARGAVPDTLGVAVTRARPPALLILDASPSFESRYVEDWLRQRGGSLALRTEISRNRYRTHFVNRPTAELSRLTPELLRGFDLVLLDARTLRGLPAAEQQVLAAATSTGLGVILIADAAPPAMTPLLTGLPLTAVGGGIRAGRVTWEKESGRARVDLAPFRLPADDETRVLATDSAGATVTAWRRRGGGAVAVSLVLTPSRWRLGGESELFATYWSRLIGAVARPPQVRWEVSQPARVDAPMQLVRAGADSGAAVVIETPGGERDSLYLAQDPVTTTRWEGSYWPRAGGWYRVIGDSAAPGFYVSSGWAAAAAAARRRATVERARASSHSRADRAPGRSRRIPDFLLFALFLTAVTVLWSERRPAA